MLEAVWRGMGWLLVICCAGCAQVGSPDGGGRDEEPPAVVFCTAYEEHAVEAFDVQAVGYLLKPVRKDDLIKVLGDLLTVLIAPEVLQNITSYLRRHVVQIELVLVTALTAVARKVIVLPTGAENKPQLLVGLGIAVVSLSAAYWLVKRANATPTRAFRELDQSAQRDGGDALGSVPGRQR